jgi:hypothetical protein
VVVSLRSSHGLLVRLSGRSPGIQRPGFFDKQAKQYKA